MEQHPLPSPSDADPRKLLEKLFGILGVLMRGWRYIVVSLAITLTLATIHAAMKKREDAIKKDPAALSRYQPVESPATARREDPELALLTGMHQ